MATAAGVTVMVVMETAAEATVMVVMPTAAVVTEMVAEVTAAEVTDSTPAAMTSRRCCTSIGETAIRPEMCTWSR